MDEFDLIRRYFVRQDDSTNVITGIGDDGAVLAPVAGNELVTVIDTLVENTHFPSNIDAADLGYRVVAVNLSDMAAMGGRPLWMTLALTIPAADADWLRDFAGGLHEATVEHDVSLVGGDTTKGDIVVVSVQLSGDVVAGKAMLRSGARAGDSIYVTGTVGDAAAGLELMSAGTPNEILSQRFLRPTARVAVGRILARFAGAAIDVSDGLYADLQKLLQASGVGAEIDIDRLPLSSALTSAFDPQQQRRFALCGGDDYELCFTSSQNVAEEIDGVPVTCIGQVCEGDDLILRDGGGVVSFEDSGYLHFQ